MRLRGFFCLTLLLSGYCAEAIIIRHDVDDAAYHMEDGAFPTTAFFHLGGSFGEGVGTLVAPHWVLTAGHVALFVQPGGIVTIADRQYRIAESIPHPEYQLNVASHDIGMVRLAEAVDGVVPARLYEGRDEVGLTAVFVGAGDTGNGRSGITGNDGRIRVARNRIEAATEQWLNFVFDPPPEALPLEGISGPGDSGGPAYVKVDSQWQLAGVSAFQENSGEEGVYGVKEYYARVSQYLDWIAGTLKSSMP